MHSSTQTKMVKQFRQDVKELLGYNLIGVIYESPANLFIYVYSYKDTLDSLQELNKIMYRNSGLLCVVIESI